MAGKDMLMVRQKELKRLHIIRKVIEGELTQVEAAEMVSLSERQVRRIVARIREEGDESIRHRSRGRQSNRKLSQKLKDKVIALYQKEYTGFGPTLTAEKLSERDGIQLSKETIRTWLLEAGQWQKKRRSRKHRQWRERKHRYGEMLQIDGSHHDWFEGRGPKCVLLAYIDDATSNVYCRFYGYEGTIPAMDSFKRYIRRHGMPMSLYLDKHTTYKSWAKPSEEDELNGTHPMSQFERAAQELGVKVIHAHSPQAKGRIERLFKTLQDRLIKEMRLRGISTMNDANEFLKQYLPVYNKRFGVKPMQEGNFHRAVPRGLDLDRILCIRTKRSLRNDFTIVHNTQLYQVLEAIKAKKVMVEERVDGSMLITHEGVRVKFKTITQRPQKQRNPSKRRKAHQPPVGAANSSWRDTNKQLFQRQALRKRFKRAAA